VAQRQVAYRRQQRAGPQRLRLDGARKALHELFDEGGRGAAVAFQF
jgi:hypothetical protein